MSHTHTLSPTRSLALSPSLPLSLPLPLALSPSASLSLSRTYPHTHLFFVALSPLSPSASHSLSLTHIPTHTLFLCRPVSPDLYPSRSHTLSGRVRLGTNVNRGFSFGVSNTRFCLRQGPFFFFTNLQPFAGRTLGRPAGERLLE